VLGWIRSAALLDGDWGTSIAYVLGIGFTLAGYTSFWHLSWMLALTALVALNYITICRLYPHGGGVYSSVAHRSKNLAVVGALLLAADYVITTALSVLDAFHYFNFSHPALGAIGVIVLLGVFNWFGPKHSGALAFGISATTLLTLFVIIAVSAPTALTATHVAPPTGGFLKNWGIFVGLILSISGIEAISNMTGLMKNPEKDSRRAILAVLAKVVIATVFLGLAMNAVPNLIPHTEDMVRFLGEHYVGHWFGWIVAAALGLLLISAGNTAINGLVSVQFLMGVDGELPSSLRRLNRFGVPIIPLVIATLAPVLVLLITHDILILAQLYAIGVVGAVLINIGSTATDSSLKLTRASRLWMSLSAIILLFVEISIAVEKPKAALFAAIVLVTGWAARVIAHRKKEELPVREGMIAKPRRKVIGEPSTSFLLALRGKSEQVLRFAIDEAKARNAMLYILRVKEIAVDTLPETMLTVTNAIDDWIEDICEEAGVDYQIITLASNEVGYTIAEHAALFGVQRVILGTSRRSLVETAVKGDIVRVISKYLPGEIEMVIFGPRVEEQSRGPSASLHERKEKAEPQPEAVA
jgi:amino acid transporter